VAASVLELVMDYCFLVSLVAWIRRKAAHDQRSEAGYANVDAFSHIAMGDGYHRKGHSYGMWRMYSY
jgi:hypothetical protein